MRHIYTSIYIIVLKYKYNIYLYFTYYSPILLVIIFVYTECEKRSLTLVYVENSLVILNLFTGARK